jgi:uncharacterized iron-regulated membrane protein
MKIPHKAKKKKSWFKKGINQIHLWLGLATGLVVFIVALTGAVYCFAPEISDARQPYRFITPQDRSFLPPSQIKEIAEKQLLGKPASRICYGSPDRAAYVMFLGKERSYYHNVYINPYSGEVLKVKNMYRDFFTIVLYLHFTLLIPYGKEIVGWCTLIFVLMLITGIILWWPRNRAARKQRFSVKWNASPKRLNYDLHNVLGFYATWIVLFIALTGLIWAFDWFAKGVYNLTGAKQSVISQKPPVSDTLLSNDSSSELALDVLWRQFGPQFQERYVSVQIILPQAKTGAFLVRANPEKKTFYKTDYSFYDQYTGKEIKGAYVMGKYSDAHTVSDKIRRMNYDIHTGAVLGLPGRMAAFLASLIIASLPVTGFYIWWGKRKKATKQQQVPQKENRSLARLPEMIT